MSRKVSLLILLGTVIAIGVLFFQVVQPFIFPLFFAAVLAVLFRPCYVWLKQHSFGHPRIAAALLTIGVLAVIMLPLGAALTLAGIQLVDAGKLGTVVAGLIQGVLAGIGFAMIGVERVWLLAVCSMLFSFIPFLGAAAVWVCVTMALLLEQRYGAAGFLAVYGTIVISGSDNLVKAHIIHGRAQMHPLIALVTVLGALQLVGLWGIFLGPIAAAFFYALLNTLKRKLLEKPAESNEGADHVADAA